MEIKKYHKEAHAHFLGTHACCFLDKSCGTGGLILYPLFCVKKPELLTHMSKSKNRQGVHITIIIMPTTWMSCVNVVILFFFKLLFIMILQTFSADNLSEYM